MADSPNILQSKTLSNFAHGFCTRRAGVSTGIYASLNLGRGSADNPDSVQHNRDQVRAFLGAESLLTPYQTHGKLCQRVTRANMAAIEAGEIKVDALVTTEPGIAIGVLTADCTPILLADQQSGVVGAAHAGWRGALAGIIEATVETMCSAGAKKHQIKAVIGPTISQSAYEVGSELRTFFVDEDPQAEPFFERHIKTNNWHFNLPHYCLWRLQRSGIDGECLDLCTYSDPDRFFSYRYNTHQKIEDYGRQGSFIRC